MLTITKKIFDNYQARYHPSQKRAFESYLIQELRSNDFQVKAEVNKFLGVISSRNIIVGDLENSKYIFTAHYDTCSLLPFPNYSTPLNRYISLLTELPILLAIVLVSYLCAHALATQIKGFGLPFVLLIPILPFFIGLTLLLSMYFGVPSHHTANDNTSGVVTLIEAMFKLPNTLKNRVAFVFFDHEEKFLLGSAAFKQKYKDLLENKIIVNFDCVGDGENLFIAVNNSLISDKNLIKNLSEAFDVNRLDPTRHIRIETGDFDFASDYSLFSNAIGVCSLKKNKSNLYYIDKIHTIKDNTCDMRNIDFLSSAVVSLAKLG
jgi:hypothetical protein